MDKVLRWAWPVVSVVVYACSGDSGRGGGSDGGEEPRGYDNCLSSLKVSDLVLVPSGSGNGLVDPPIASGDGGVLLDCTDVLTEIGLQPSQCAELCRADCDGQRRAADRCTVTPVCDASGPVQYVNCEWDG